MRRDGTIYAAFLLTGAAIFVVAALLPPAPSGIGTHEALGLPPCPLHALTGVPCPACGMTTSFALVARGRLAEAFAAQPFGALLATGLAAGMLVTPLLAWARVPPSRIGERLGRSWVAFGTLVLLLLAWGYKIGTVIRV